MLPFLQEDIQSMTRALMNKIVKPEVLAKTKNSMLSTLDLHEAKNLRSEVNVGFVTLEATKNSSGSPRQLLAFNMECKLFTVAVLEKFFLKSPLKYSLVRNVNCLDPSIIAAKNKSVLEKKFRNMLQILITNGLLRGEQGDIALRQYMTLVCDSSALSQLTEAAQLSDGEKNLDTLFHRLLSTNTDFKDLWFVVQRLLLLSHGQASVERSFSINKMMSMVNLLPENLTSRRIIKDHISSVGGVSNVSISKQMLNAVAMSNCKYKDDLERKKMDNERAEKRRHENNELIQQKKRRKSLVTEIESLEKKAFSLADEASTKGSTQLFQESHALNIRARSLKKHITQLEAQIKSLETNQN